jgi:hypothetical protein
LLEVAGATEVEVMMRGCTVSVTDRLNATFVVRVGEPASVTVTTIGKLPEAVGVPEMVPLFVRVSPAGSALADQL